MGCNGFTLIKLRKEENIMSTVSALLYATIKEEIEKENEYGEVSESQCTESEETE